MPKSAEDIDRMNSILEAGYWRYDAMVKGYDKWKSAPMTERDAFKSAALWVHMELEACSK